MRKHLDWIAGAVFGLLLGLGVAWATSPNMGMTIPVPGVTPGPQYAVDVSDALNIIDAHTHAPGFGALVPTAGLNINADLPFNNAYSMTAAKSVQFHAQGSPISGATTDALYTSGVDLYYNDGNGTQIQVTANGTLNASTFGGFTGLAGTSGEALYTNGSGMFSYTSAAGTSASVTSGPVTIRDVTNGVTKGITLKSPTSLANAYSLTLPAAIASNSTPTLLTESSSGVLATDATSGTGIIGTVAAKDVAVLKTAGSTAAYVDIVAAAGMGSTYTMTLPTAVPVAEAPLFMSAAGALDTTGTGAVATSMLANLAVTNAKLAALNTASSSSTNSFTTTSATFTNVTNAAVTLTTAGRPVMIFCQADSTGGSNGAAIGTTASGGNTPYAEFRIVVSGSASANIGHVGLVYGASINGQIFQPPVGVMSTFYAPAAGTYTFTLQTLAGANNTVAVSNTILVAYEI